MNPSIPSSIQLTPVVVSFILLGAHFLRSGHLFLVALCFVLLGLLFVKRRIIARFVQMVLVLATIEWVYTAFFFVTIRMENGLPWVRLVIILGGVACFTLASASVFFLKTQKERYSL